MNCSDMILLISGHLDGVNSQDEESLLQEHLAECTSCRQLFEMLRGNDALLASVEEETPSGLCEAVMTKIREEKKQQKRSARIWSGLAASAAAVALLLGAGTVLLPKGSSKGAVIDVAEPQEAETAVYYAAKTTADIMSFDGAAEEESMEEAVEEAAPAEAPMAAQDTSAADYQQLADRLGCVVVCLDHFAEDLHTCAVETAEDGTCLYVLTDANEAEELSQAYGGVVYVPAEIRSGCAYAIVIGE